MNETYTAGRALSLGLKVFFKNLIPFTILAVLCSLPHIAYTYFKLDELRVGMFGFSDEYFELKLLLISQLVGLLMTSTLTYGVVMELKGQRATMGACIAVGIKRLLPVFGVGLLIGLIIFIPLVLGILVLMAIPLDLFGLILLGVMIGMIYAIYYVAIPASVLERPGIGGALLRSRELTTGRRGGVFGTIVLLIVAQWLVRYVVTDAMVDPRSLMDGGEDALIHLVKKLIWVNVGITMFFSMLSGTIAAVTYYLLRSEKEGTSADDLASVFD